MALKAEFGSNSGLNEGNGGPSSLRLEESKTKQNKTNISRIHPKSDLLSSHRPRVITSDLPLLM